MAIVAELHFGDNSYNSDMQPAEIGERVPRIAKTCNTNVDGAWGGIWQYNLAASVNPPLMTEEGLRFFDGVDGLQGVNGSSAAFACVGIWVKVLTISGNYGIIQVDLGVAARRAAIWQVNNQFRIITNNSDYTITGVTLVANTWYYCAVGVTSAAFYVDGSAAASTLNGTPSTYTNSWLGRCVNSSVSGGTINGNCIISDVYLFDAVTSTVQKRTYKQQNYPTDLLAQPTFLRQSESRQFMQNSRGT